MKNVVDFFLLKGKGQGRKKSHEREKRSPRGRRRKSMRKKKSGKSRGLWQFLLDVGMREQVENTEANSMRKKERKRTKEQEKEGLSNGAQGR